MRIAATVASLTFAFGTGAGAQFQISEIRTGGDPQEYVEITGTPGASLDGVTFLIIGDGTTTGASPTLTGVVEWKWTFTRADLIGPNGHLVLHNPLMSAFAVDAGATAIPWIVGNPVITATGFEESDNQTYLLVTGYSGTDTFIGRAPNQGAGGQDLDTDDDGVLDITPWASIIDSVAIRETPQQTPQPGQDWWYSSATAGPNIWRTVLQTTTGDVIAGWDYQTTTNGGTSAAGSPNTPKVFQSNAGSGTQYLDGTHGSSDWIQAGELDSFAGTDINATGPSGNGLSTTSAGFACLAMVNQTANGKSTVFKFSMSGRTMGVHTSYAARRSTTGFTSHQWAWSTDGMTWTDFALLTDISPNMYAFRSLGTLNALNGAPEAYLRLTVNGNTAGSLGNNRIDNLLLLSNAVTTDTIVTNYSAPLHVLKESAETSLGKSTWSVGLSATTGGWDTPGSGNHVTPSLTCGSASSESCDADHFYPYCNDSCCCEYVCQSDSYCCQVHWDSICVTKAGECSTACPGGECPADFNRDMIVDGADLGTLLGSWGTPDHDLTGDRFVDGADLGQLLGAWGPCN